MLFLIESWVSHDFYHALCHLCCSCIAGYYLHYYGFLFSSLFMSLQRTLDWRFYLLVECMELLIMNSFSIFQKKCNKMKITLRLVFIAVTLYCYLCFFSLICWKRNFDFIIEIQNCWFWVHQISIKISNSQTSSYILCRWCSNGVYVQRVERGLIRNSII